MSEVVIVDTGPLVALFNQRDRHHAWVVESLRADLELVTCEAVLSEALFLLSRVPAGRTALLTLLAEGGVATFPLAGEVRAVVSLMRRYASVPMSFADACLVRISELHRDAPLLTLDADFTVYRRFSRQVLPVRMPR